MSDQDARIERDDASPVRRMDGGGPWGAGDEDGGRDEGSSRGNPWTQPSRRRRPGLRPGGGGQPSLEELIRRSRARLGGGLPGRGGRPLWGYALAAFVLLWLLTTSVHQVDAGERGVVTRFGRYAGTLSPGIGVTLPAPVDVVTRVNVDRANTIDLPESGGQNLLLAADGGLVNLAYSVRWSVRDPERFLFEQDGPEDLVRSVADGAMRDAVGRVAADRVASRRAAIEAEVAARTQAVLDRYRAGIAVEGVTLRQAEAPAAVAEAAKDVPVARQQVEADLANARTYAEQVNASAQAAATSFDKVYDAYRLAPEVTRKRMYYETMEAVLAKNNKVIVDAPGTTPLLPIPLPRAGRAGEAKAPEAAAAPAPAAGQ